MTQLEPSPLVVEVAANPEAVRRLLQQHVPNDDSRCRACTTPGTGTPGAAWPCSLYLIADSAREWMKRRTT